MKGFGIEFSIYLFIIRRFFYFPRVGLRKIVLAISWTPLGRHAPTCDVVWLLSRA